MVSFRDDVVLRRKLRHPDNSMWVPAQTTRLLCSNINVIAYPTESKPGDKPQGSSSGKKKKYTDGK
jgi:hypothetical protein